jgi:hypothetical protein
MLLCFEQNKHHMFNFNSTELRLCSAQKVVTKNQKMNMFMLYNNSENCPHQHTQSCKQAYRDSRASRFEQDEHYPITNCNSGEGKGCIFESSEASTYTDESGEGNNFQYLNEQNLFEHTNNCDENNSHADEVSDTMLNQSEELLLKSKQNIIKRKFAEITTIPFTQGLSVVVVPLLANDINNQAETARLLKNSQDRLLLMFHSQICTHNEPCPAHPQLCGAMKKLMAHIKHCQQEDICKVRFCIGTKHLQRHASSCSSSKCERCAPLRCVINTYKTKANAFRPIKRSKDVYVVSASPNSTPTVATLSRSGLWVAHPPLSDAERPPRTAPSLAGDRFLMDLTDRDVVFLDRCGEATSSLLSMFPGSSRTVHWAESKFALQNREIIYIL